MEAKERSTARKNFGDPAHFYMDMRFWLIVLMLAAFVGFLLIQTPSS
jgi:hypothetical protein